MFRARKFRKPLVPQSRVWTCCCAEEIPFDQGDLAESLVCLGPLSAGQSPYILPHHEGQGVHWEVFKIYLRSISSLFWLDWFVQAKLFLMNQIFWKINIEIWNRRLVDLRQSRDGVDKVTTFSYIYIIAHYGDLHADTHPRTSKLACHLSLKKFLVSTELCKGITDFAHLC